MTAMNSSRDARIIPIPISETKTLLVSRVESALQLDLYLVGAECHVPIVLGPAHVAALLDAIGAFQKHAEAR
jgi:hypothetical protein